MNEFSSLQFLTARAERSHDDAQSFDGRSDCAQACPYRQLALDLERGRSIALAKGPMAAKARGPTDDRMLGQIDRGEGGTALVEESSQRGEGRAPASRSSETRSIAECSTHGRPRKSFPCGRPGRTAAARGGGHS